MLRRAALRSCPSPGVLLRHPGTRRSAALAASLRQGFHQEKSHEPGTRNEVEAFSRRGARRRGREQQGSKLRSDGEAQAPLARSHASTYGRGKMMAEGVSQKPFGRPRENYERSGWSKSGLHRSAGRDDGRASPNGLQRKKTGLVRTGGNTQGLEDDGYQTEASHLRRNGNDPMAKASSTQPSSGGLTHSPSLDNARQDTTFTGRESLNGNESRISYAAPDSEFLYGTSVVEAALIAGRRKCYKLYASGRSSDTRRDHLLALAKSKSVQVEMLDPADGMRRLDRLSNGRQHNGLVLEASPLPRSSVVALAAMDSPHASLIGILDEIESSVPAEATITAKRDQSLYPLILMLEGLTDTGNVGNVMRSAYYLGVDAVVFSGLQSPLTNPVILKASSGAAEFLPAFTAKSSVAFLSRSKAAGWKVYAADAPQETSEPQLKGRSRYEPRSVPFSTLDSPLAKAPCILLLGGEGEGLRRTLLRQADYTLSIPRQPDRSASVDSLNVATAAGILCGRFLHPTSQLETKAPMQDRIF